MDREFEHSYLPAHEDPVGSGDFAKLSVDEIEDAGLVEVLQTPGVGLGHWKVLEPLLDENDSRFVFREPLGQSREVKVALSGLFGRFVARAYLTRYLGLQFFAHLSPKGVVLDRHLNLGVIKTSRGDLPDWVAAPADYAYLAIAEAKGSHDSSGPRDSLARAWKQANRIDITKDRKRLGVKRIAVVTRWGVKDSEIPTPQIAVRDPVEEGDWPDRQFNPEATVGIVRHHIANLIEPLGHVRLARTLRILATAEDYNGSRVTEEAQMQLDIASTNTDRSDEADQALVGGVVSRAGPLPTGSVTNETIDLLESIDMRPVFVGVREALILSAIQGEMPVEPTSTADFQRPDTYAEDPTELQERTVALAGRGYMGTRVIRLTPRETDELPAR